MCVCDGNGFITLRDKKAFHPQLHTYSYSLYFPRPVLQVVPEIDVPAHVASWAKGVPEIVINCQRVSESTGYDQFKVRLSVCLV